MITKLRAVEPNEPLTAREEAHQAVKRYKSATSVPQYSTPWVVEPERVNALPVDEILRRSEPNDLIGKT